MNKANLSIAGLALLIAGFGFLGGITTERVLLAQESSGAHSIAEQLIQDSGADGAMRERLRNRVLARIRTDLEMTDEQWQEFEVILERQRGDTDVAIGELRGSITRSLERTAQDFRRILSEDQRRQLHELRLTDVGLGEG
ncbi:MAG: hypothetical protein HKN95_01400 [Acidimicrobiia bacterium]|nr:hypothetical protein [Acidimicrobiia bacterium]